MRRILTMEQWEIFTTKKELKHYIKVIQKKGIEIFEVRELTYIEKLTYISDPIMFINKPHIIMFNATEEEYKTLLKELDLSPVF